MNASNQSGSMNSLLNVTEVDFIYDHSAGVIYEHRFKFSGLLAIILVICAILSYLCYPVFKG